MKKLRYGVLGALGAFLCFYVASAGAEPPSPAPFAGGMIDRDPSVPEPATPPASVQALPSAGARERVEVPGTTPGGGWKMEGPFIHTMRATTGADGTVTTDCMPDRPGE
jgi:hypothetical protein